MSIRGGRAEGPLVGGNLSLLCATLGTVDQPDTEGAIVFSHNEKRLRQKLSRQRIMRGAFNGVGEQSDVIVPTSTLVKGGVSKKDGQGKSHDCSYGLCVSLSETKRTWDARQASDQQDAEAYRGQVKVTIVNVIVAGEDEKRGDGRYQE